MEQEDKKAWGLAKQVGELWQQITYDNGCYFNCHDEKYLKRYKRLGNLGVGMINRNNLTQVNNAINTALYLTQPSKLDQRLKVQSPRMQAFAKGEYYTAKRRRLPKMAI